MAWGQIISLMWRLQARIPLSRALRFSRRRITKPWSIKCALIWRPSPRRGHYRHSSRVFASDRGLQSHPGVAHRAGRCRNPLSAYAKLAQGPRSFLFESVEGGERWGRYSIIGLPAKTWLTVEGYRLSLFESVSASRVAT